MTIIVGGVALVAIVVAATTGDGASADVTTPVDDAETTATSLPEGPTPTTAPLDAPTAPDTVAEDQPTKTSEVETTRTEPQSSGEETSDSPGEDPLATDITVPTVSIPQTNEATTCEAIIDHLSEYRDLAITAEAGDLPTLQFSLEEFEHEVDFLGAGHDWSNAIIEQLVVVRRHWSTAYSAAVGGERSAAQESEQAALAALDAAIGIGCPPS